MSLFEYAIGDKVYITSRGYGVKPYSVLTVTGFSYSSGNTEYILRDENNEYRVRDVDELRPYNGQNLKKQQIRDIVLLILELAGLLLVTIALSLWSESIIKGL